MPKSQPLSHSTEPPAIGLDTDDSYNDLDGNYNTRDINAGLPTDIERVLQDAIADINASVGGGGDKGGKKRPRTGDEDGDGEQGAEVRKKKKKKAKDGADGEAPRLKSKKKDKGKERERHGAPPTTSSDVEFQHADEGAVHQISQGLEEEQYIDPDLDPPYLDYGGHQDLSGSEQEHAHHHQQGMAIDANFLPSFLNSLPALPLPAIPTNEDILSALRQIDLSKFANSLRMSGGLVQADMNGGAAGPTTSRAATSGSGTLGDGQSSRKERLGMRNSKVPKGVLDNVEEMDHATLLATKWLNPSKLSELVRTEGLQYKKGKFSALEEEQIKKSLQDYRIARNMSEDMLRDVIFAKGKKAREANAMFWSEITLTVPQRPIIAVYHHIRRTFHPLKRMGKWTEEEDAMLRAAVQECGQAWEKVSEKVGRMSSDCRDRYRNHIVNREARKTGAWSKEEEEELTRIVREMTTDQGKNAENDIFWGIVSSRMDNKRTRQQCRIKWTDALNKRVKNSGTKPRWSAQDAYILVQKIASLEISHDSEIDWKLISDSDWNLWSAHQLQRRWFRLKKSIKGSDDMALSDLLEILKQKKALPPLGQRTSRMKSKATVDDGEDADIDEGSELEDEGMVEDAIALDDQGEASVVGAPDEELEEEDV